MKEGDIFIERLHDAMFRNYQARLLFLALAGEDYDPVWWYWADYLKANRN